MKRWSVWLMAGVGLAALLWAVAFRSGSVGFVNLPPTAFGPWIAFGDSLTEGYGAPPGEDYPAQLASRLGIPITNLGRSGDTTSDGLARVDEVVSLRPRVVLLCLGGNDELRRQSRTEMMGNLGMIIDRLQNAGSFVVLIGVRSVSVRDRNEKAFVRLAREKRVLHLPDLLEGVMFHSDLMSDALHPNERGYARIAERFENELGPWLSQLR